MPGIALAIIVTIVVAEVPPQIWIVIVPADTTGMKPAGTKIFIASAHAISHADSVR